MNSISRPSPLALAVVCLLWIAWLAPAARASNTFAATGSLAKARHIQTGTLLPNGKVLVAGGFNSATSAYLATAELYDPATGTWSATGSLANITPRRCCPAARSSSPGGKIAPAILPARSYTIRPRGSGALPVRSPPGAAFTPPRCWPAARFSWRGATVATRRAPRFTIQLRARGPPPAPSMSGAIITPRHCWPMARCSWPVEKPAPLSPARSSTIRMPAPGASPVRSSRRASITPPRCCRMAKCWWPVVTMAAST